MNSEFFCPIRGCPHSIDGDKAPFLTRSTLIRHLHTPSHSSTHHLVNQTRCANAGIYTCCTSSCPSSPKIFFSSLRALHDHCITIHPPLPLLQLSPPNPPPPPLQSHLISSTLIPPHTQQTIGLMVFISSPQFTTTNPPTSEQHGATSSASTTNGMMAPTTS
jgi:hypothetical protein